MKTPLIALAISLATAGCSQKHLICHITFDDEASLVSPSVGPTGIVDKATFEPGVKGSALLVKASQPPVAIYQLPENFLSPRGCIEFWAKISGERDTYGGCDPIFYQVFYAPGIESSISFTSNNGAALHGLVGRLIQHNRITARGFGGSYPYREILGDDVHGWHHYAFTWNTEGVTDYTCKDGTPSQAVLFIDGKPYLDHNLEWGKDNAAALIKFIANPAKLGFPSVNGATASDYLIDEFKIWDIDKIDFEIP